MKKREQEKALHHLGQPIGQDRRTMPCGSVLVVDRLRSAGPLNTEEHQFCRISGIPIAYDPLQSGWITKDAVDDICENSSILEPNEARRSASFRDSNTDLTFRAWNATDARRYADLLSEPEVWRYLYEDYPGALSEEEAEDLIALANTTNHHRVWAIVKDGQAIGQTRLEFGENGAEPELSYWIGVDHWGQGIGSAAVRRFGQQSLRDDPTLQSLTARVHADNSASSRVLAKAGFQPLGADPDAPDWHRFILRR